MKKWLCNVNPVNLASGIVLATVLAVEAYFIGFYIFFLIVGAVIVLLAVLGGIGYGLYRGIKYLQSRCNET